jgi:hypothetical protein
MGEAFLVQGVEFVFGEQTELGALGDGFAGFNDLEDIALFDDMDAHGLALGFDRDEGDEGDDWDTELKPFHLFYHCE